MAIAIGALEAVPATQDVQPVAAGNPNAPEYFPAPHAVQKLSAVAAVVPEYFP